MNIVVFCSASDDLAPEYYTAAESLGEWIGNNGHTLVYGGTSQGLMQSIAKGTKKSGGATIAILPKFMYDNGLVSSFADDIILVDGLSERKERMLRMGDVFVALPGGFGTLDEVFHVIASGQVGTHSKQVIMLNTNNFYAGIKQQTERAFAERFTPSEYEDRLIIKDDVHSCIREIKLAIKRLSEL